MIRQFLAAIVLAMLASSAFAFGTIGTLGQHTEHEKITRLALSCQYRQSSDCFAPNTMDVFAGTFAHFGAVGRPDDPTVGMMSNDAAHCDNGDYLVYIPNYPQSKDSARHHLDACKSWMKAHFAQALEDAAQLLDVTGKSVPNQLDINHCDTYARHIGTAKCRVLEQFGIMMHASQDFYSHTNWVDKPGRGKFTIENPPGLEQRQAAPWISMNPQNEKGFSEGLISGCYNGWPEWDHCVHHLKHDYLNKDKGAIDMKTGKVGEGSTHRGKIEDNFKWAVTYAVIDSKDKWADLTGALMDRYGSDKGRRIACLIAKDSAAGCP